MSRTFSEEDKRRIMNDYSKSGLNVPGYSRQSGVSETTLYKWQNELRNMGRDNQINKNNIQEFIELGVNKPSYYEISSKDISLKIPSTEAVSRIIEIFKKLSAC